MIDFLGTEFIRDEKLFCKTKKSHSIHKDEKEQYKATKFFCTDLFALEGKICGSTFERSFSLLKHLLIYKKI